MAKILAICNQKGGTGKTTTCISLGSYLALAGKKTLIIDVDPQGNATSGLGVDKRSLGNSIYNVLINHLEIKETILSTQIENLHLAPSHLNLTGAEIELVEMEEREFRLKESINSIASLYNYILIDTPPSLGLLTINALVGSNSVLIPLQCEYYALEGLSQLLHTIGLVKERLNPQLEIEGILLTMADFRTNLTAEVIGEVRRFFSAEGGYAFGKKDKVYQTIIPRNVRLSEAPGFGKPIIIYDKDSIGAKRYQELSKEILYGEESARQGVSCANPGEGTGQEREDSLS